MAGRELQGWRIIPAIIQAELQTCQARVEAILLAQLGRAADFHDVAIFHHHDAIRLLHRCKSMGDDQSGASFHGGIQALLHQYLRFGIQRAGRFIQ